MEPFIRHNEMTYEGNAYYAQNEFVTQTPNVVEPVNFEDIKDQLPKPIFDGHEDYIKCYYDTWKIGFGNIRKPVEGSGFVSSFIDTAFNGCLFMWDSSFIMMFTKYANHLFPFQGTLDNFYALQHRDGFICREIDEATGRDRFARHDPSSTGPNVMPWSELVYFENTRDMERLRKIYAPLRAYHEWYRKNHTWPDGSYFASGWGCGMDNVPRLMPGYDHQFSHGHMIWNDISFQQIISCNILIRMNEELGGKDDVSDLIEERDRIAKVVNEKLWDDKTNFYYDMWKTGELNMVKHVGAYWALLANVVPKDKLDAFVAHLENEAEFNRPTPVPTLSADSPNYDPRGGYWCGGVWAPTNYMILQGLDANGYYDVSHRIAEKYLRCVVDVYNQTGTVWENYAPEATANGYPSKDNFVGWTGLASISVFFEHVMGIKPEVPNNRVVWHVNHLEKHGVLQCPFGVGNLVDLVCEARASEDEEPQITFKAKQPLTLVVKWKGGEKTIQSEQA